jgi:hypothetical protein
MPHPNINQPALSPAELPIAGQLQGLDAQRQEARTKEIVYWGKHPIEAEKVILNSQGPAMLERLAGEVQRNTQVIDGPQGMKAHLEPYRAALATQLSATNLQKAPEEQGGARQKEQAHESVEKIMDALTQEVTEESARRGDAHRYLRLRTYKGKNGADDSYTYHIDKSQWEYDTQLLDRLIRLEANKKAMRIAQTYEGELTQLRAMLTRYATRDGYLNGINAVHASKYESATRRGLGHMTRISLVIIGTLATAFYGATRAWNLAAVAGLLTVFAAKPDLLKRMTNGELDTEIDEIQHALSAVRNQAGRYRMQGNGWAALSEYLMEGQNDASLKEFLKKLDSHTATQDEINAFVESQMADGNARDKKALSDMIARGEFPGFARSLLAMQKQDAKNMMRDIIAQAGIPQ